MARDSGGRAQAPRAAAVGTGTEQEAPERRPPAAQHSRSRKTLRSSPRAGHGGQSAARRAVMRPRGRKP